MKNNNLLFAAIIFLITFNSCVDLDVELENYVDTYISTKIIGGDTLFALGGYAQSNYSIDTVTMKTPNNRSFDLEQIDYNGGIFETETSDSDYSKVIPEKGNYIYTISYPDQSTVQETDILSDKIIYPAVLTEVTPSSTGNTVLLKWTAVKDADSYFIKGIEDEKIIFVSSLIDSKNTSFTLTPFTTGWGNQNQPKPGKEYQFFITAVLYETGTAQYIQTQCVSYSERVKAIWPE